MVFRTRSWAHYGDTFIIIVNSLNQVLIWLDWLGTEKKPGVLAPDSGSFNERSK